MVKEDVEDTYEVAAGEFRSHAEMLEELGGVADALDALAETIAALHMRRAALIRAGRVSGLEMAVMARGARVTRTTAYTALQLANPRAAGQLALFGAVSDEGLPHVKRAARWATTGGSYLDVADEG